jgi:hypothetical protein
MMVMPAPTHFCLGETNFDTTFNQPTVGTLSHVGHIHDEIQQLRINAASRTLIGFDSFALRRIYICLTPAKCYDATLHYSTPD